MSSKCSVHHHSVDRAECRVLIGEWRTPDDAESLAFPQRDGARIGRHHKVELMTSGSFSAEVFGDRSQLVSAFSNLVENAIKYSEEDRLVEIIGDVRVGDLTVAVVDQGLGIAPKDHERIFERFYRVDRARSRSTGGTGLGLSIVRHVIDNHGGKIEVKSNEGEGATFTVVLPRQKD